MSGIGWMFLMVFMGKIRSEGAEVLFPHEPSWPEAWEMTGTHRVCMHVYGRHFFCDITLNAGNVNGPTTLSQGVRIEVKAGHWRCAQARQWCAKSQSTGGGRCNARQANHDPRGVWTGSVLPAPKHPQKAGGGLWRCKTKCMKNNTEPRYEAGSYACLRGNTALLRHHNHYI